MPGSGNAPGAGTHPDAPARQAAKNEWAGTVHEFIETALEFPAGSFTIALAVVVAYRLIVLCGFVEHDAWESDAASAALGTLGSRSPSSPRC
ncbi:hypothetical protein [Streptomyces sp. ISL-86]|uniref:hypothetical protein n=1 Tax=Streptomyces sp. ISL-86 TaxID=2819187 RepID=UPI001BE4E624|nr:hypothetical protein [Streptomyces sp. ISL-86]MBT2457373.1 hypothetical protein [Streptomyces sp. ISL-86]